MPSSPSIVPETRVVPIADLVPHPMNANAMPPDLFEKLRGHLRRNGRYPAVIVRPHPEEPTKFEVIDGHHRARALESLGHETVRVDIWNVDDTETRVLLATLNRLEGDDIPVRRAELLHSLLGSMSSADLASLVPESEAEIRDLHALLEFPAGDIAAQLADEAAETEKTLPVVLTYVVHPEHATLIADAVERASDGITGRDRKARGLLNLARHYLEGAPDADAPTEA